MAVITLDDLLADIFLAIGPPWSGERDLGDRLANVQASIAGVVWFGDPGGGLVRAIEVADARRVRRADLVALEETTR